MKINFRQLSIMTFLSFISLKFLVLPSMLYRFSGNMSWLVVLVLMSLDGIYAYLLIWLAEKNQYQDISEFMKQTVGTVLSKVILVVLTLMFALEVANICKGLEFFVVENFYNDFNWILYVLPLIALVGFMIYKGIRNIARVQELFCWAIIIGCLYIVIKSLSGVDFLEYLPMFKDGVAPLFKSGFRHMNWFGSSTFIMMLFGRVDFKNAKKKKAVFYILGAIVLVQIVHFIFYGLFGITSPTHTFAISDVSQFSSTKSIIDELSWLVVSLWVVEQSIQLAVYGYCLVQAIVYLFELKNQIVIIFLVDLFIFSLGYIGSKTINLEQIFFTPFVSIITIISQYIIPLILYIGYIMRRRRERRTNNEKVEVNL